MNKYAVGILMLFDNENMVFIVDAENEVEALLETIRLFWGSTNGVEDENITQWLGVLRDELHTVEELIIECFHSDICLSKPVII